MADSLDLRITLYDLMLTIYPAEKQTAYNYDWFTLSLRINRNNLYLIHSSTDPLYYNCVNDLKQPGQE